METYISILRGINVGSRKVLMADLKRIYEALKLKGIITYIQSGNVIFKGDKKTDSEVLSEKISRAILRKYGFEVPVIIRRAKAMKNVVAANPFLMQKGINKEKLHVTFLSEIPEKEYLEHIKQYDYAPDQFIIKGSEVFLHCPDTYGNTKLSNTFFENKLKVKATTRNWNTVTKLLELAGSGQE